MEDDDGRQGGFAEDGPPNHPMYHDGQQFVPLPAPRVDLGESTLEASSAKKQWVKRHMNRHVSALSHTRSYVHEEVQEHQRDVKRNKVLIGYGKRKQTSWRMQQQSIDRDNETLLQRLVNLPGTELTSHFNKASSDHETSQLRHRNRVLAKLAVRKVEIEKINFENSVRTANNWAVELRP